MFLQHKELHHLTFEFVSQGYRTEFIVTLHTVRAPEGQPIQDGDRSKNMLLILSNLK